MRTTFTTQVRVLLCESCGAPLEAPVGGAAVACSYCRAQNVVARRDERPTLGAPAVAPIDEAERMRRLRMQDGRPLVPPASIMYLLDGSSLQPAKVEEAFLIYNASRREVKATQSPEAAERLYFLTLIASNYLVQTGDAARRRALLETSLDTLYLPRHKQVLRGQLATAAAREGDIGAAEQWLAPCNPRSDDLESDSAWRVARAYIDTTIGRFDAVLAVLGPVDDQVPIDDSRDPVAAVLRANALERLGHGQAAVEALRARMANEAASGRQAIEHFVATNAHLHLCAQSLPIARQGHAQKAAEAAASGAGGGVGCLLLVIGAPMLLVAIGAVVLGVLAELGIRVGIVDGIGDALGLALGLGITGVILTPLGYGLWRSAREAAFMRMHGISATGIVRGIEATGTSINDVPMVRVHVQVSLHGHAPYVATAKLLLHPTLAAVIQPGRELPIRVHPHDPSKVVLELS